MGPLSRPFDQRTAGNCSTSEAGESAPCIADRAVVSSPCYREEMLKNRSVPTDVILPHVTYQNVADAVVWLTKTFGFAEHYRYGEPGVRVDGAQMHLGDAWIMLEGARPGRTSPAQLGQRTQSLTVFVDDVDGHFERAKSEGAEIVEDLHETAYGERQYGVVDLEGHYWLFSRHARDVGPDEWGATIARR